MRHNLPRKSFNISCTSEIITANLNVIFAFDGKYTPNPFNKLPKLSRFRKVGFDAHKIGDYHLFEHKNQSWLVIVAENRDYLHQSMLKAGNTIGTVAKKIGCKSISIYCYDDTSYASIETNISGIPLGINDALYNYKEMPLLEEVIFYIPTGLIENIYVELAESTQNIITGNNLYRDLLMVPSNQLGPEVLSQMASAVRMNLIMNTNNFNNVTVKNYSHSQLRNAGFNLLNAVGKSDPNNPAQIVTLEYKGAPETDEIHQMLVCKGICFDTGGINLKPGTSVANMKMDMGGAALGLGLFHTLVMNNAPYNITLVLSNAYNKVSATAMNPGDVYQSGDTTVEITNTDAEGRLALADGVGFACNHLKMKPKSIITLATLTGAARVALGKYFIPFCSNTQRDFPFNQDDLDPMVQLPLIPAHLDAMRRSETADLTNSDETGSGAGVSTAAAFIGHFVPEGTEWLHVDFSNVAKNADDISGNPKSGKQATGRAFLPVLEYILD
jgi:leucyl aminopeptidase